MSDRFDNDPYGPLVEQAASAYNVDPSVIRAILHRESAGNPTAVSPAGAGGLMQLMPATAAGLGVTDRFDPAQNIDAGTRYYRQMLDRFGGDPELALAAYNAGPGRVDKHLATGAPLPAETRAYVPAVMARAGQGAARSVDPLSLLPEDAQIIGDAADPLASLPPDAVILGGGTKPAKPTENPSFASVRRGFSRFKQGAAGVAADAGLLTPETAAKTISEEQRYQQQIAAPKETQDAMRRMSEAGSVAEFLSALYEQPGALLTIMGESLGQGGPGMAVGALGALGGPVGFGAAQGLASGATEYASSVLQSLGDAGVDLSDPKSVQAGLSDPERMAAAREFALKRGVPVGLFDGLSAGLAGKITRLAGGPQTVRGAIGRGLGEMGLQAGAGAAGEAGAQLASEGRISKPGDVALEGAAEIPGGMVETGMGARMHGRERVEATPARVEEEPSQESVPLALPAPQPQGDGFVMGDRPEVRQAQADAQRFSDEMDSVQQAMSAAQTPEDRAALVERWTAARDGYIAARNRLDNLAPQPPKPEGVRPPDTNPPLPPRNLPDVYRGATDDPAMAALPPDAVLLEAPQQQGRRAPDVAQREEPAAPVAARADAAEIQALPDPASTAANRFMDAQSQQATDLQKLIDRRTREMGALQKQIAAEVDPAERARKTNLFRKKNQQVEEVRARLGELRPQEAPRDVQEVRKAPLANDQESPTKEGGALRWPLRNREVFNAQILGDDGTPVGVISGRFIRGDIQVRTTEMDDVAKGKGFGVRGYAELADTAHRQGGALLSDGEVTEAAARVYEALARRGYKVTRNPSARWIDDDGERKLLTKHRSVPVFRVEAGSADPQASASVPMDGWPASTPPQPGDRVRVTNAKTGQTYEATLTGERGPRTLVTRDDGKKLQPLTAAHSIERAEAVPKRAASVDRGDRFQLDMSDDSRIQRAQEQGYRYVRRNRNDDEPFNSVGHAMFAKAKDLESGLDSLRHYGESGWVSRDSDAVDVSDIQKDIVRAIRRRGLQEEYQSTAAALAREAAPEDIVSSAGIWDSPDIVQAIYDDIIEPRGIGAVRTPDGLIRFDAKNTRNVKAEFHPGKIEEEGYRLRLTDEAERAAPALEADLRAQLKRYGIDDRVGFRLVDAIRNRQTGEAIPGALGRYGRRVIEVATSAPDRAMTLDHEAVHAFRELGLLTQKEWDALKQAALRDDGVKLASVRRRYRNMNLDEESMFEEAVADLFADWQAGRRDAGPVRAILERIRDFLAAVGQAFRGQGFTTPESVFRAIDEGRIGRRGAQEAPAGAMAEAFERQQRPEGQGEASPERDSFALAPTEQALADAILADQPSLAERVKKAFGANRSGIGSEAVRQFVNQFEPIFQAEMRAEKAAGRQAKLRDARVSAAKMTELAVQDSGRLESMLVEGPLRWNAQEGIAENVPGVGGLLDIFKPLKNADDYKRFQIYAIARRAKRLKAEGRENLLSDAQIREGMALGTPEFQQVFDGYQKFNKAMLDFAVDTGVIKAALRDLYASSMDYVPFFRVAEETGELPPPATLSKLSNPDPKIRKLEGGTDKIGDLAENVIRNATALAKAGMRNEAMRRIHGVLEEIGEARNLTDADEKAGSVAFFDKGTKRHFIAEDPAMMAAMAGLRPEQHAGIYKALASFSNVLRRGVTASPGFVLANFIRDSASAWVQTGGTLTLANNGVTGLIRAAKGANSVKELKTIAGVGGYEFGHGARDMAAELKRRLGVEVATTPKAILDKILRPLEEVGSWTEVANRDAIYRNLLEKGAKDPKNGPSKAEAAYQALNLLNFSRKGANQSLRFMLPLVPFLNARIQGLYRLAETQGDRAALKGVLARGLLLTGVSAALYGVFGDDDAYKDAPIERRLNYYIVPVGDSKVLIPKPFEFGAIFSTMPEFLFDAIRKEDGADLAKATAMTFLNTFSFNPIPQAVRPALEVVTNYDFFTGRPVEGPREQKLAPGERANAQTNATLKALGREANVSPMKAEHLISGYLGTLGQMALAGMDAVMGASGAVPSKPAGAFGSVPILSPTIESAFGRFYKTGPDAANRWVGDFYDLKHQADETWATIRKLRQDGEVERAKDLQRDNAGLVASRKQIEKMGEQIGGLTRQINDVRADDEMSPEEKRQKMDTLIAKRNAIARRTETILQRIKARNAAAVERSAA